MSVAVLEPKTQASVTVAFELIDPDTAAKYLERNVKNRALKTQKIAGYVRDMQAGNWRSDTVEPVKFERHGNLIDGQNRMWAVLQSGCTVGFWVARGLDPDVQDVIDSGTPRGASDTLRLAGIANSNLAAAVTSKVAAWNAGARWRLDALKGTNAEVKLAYLGDPRIEEAVKAADRWRAIPAPASVVGLAYYLFSEISLRQADFFFDRFATGSDLPAGHPVLGLRNRLVELKARTGRRTVLRAEVTLAAIIRSWNAFRDGRELRRVYLEGRSDVFPEPK